MTIYENERFAVELHPHSPKPFWVVSKTVKNPLHAEECFYDRERAIRFADDLIAE